MCDHVAHFRERLALLACSASARYVYAALPHRCCFRAYVLDDGASIDDRIGVGHAADVREATMRCRTRAAFNIFLVLLARVAQMNMHINEAGHNHLATEIPFDALSHLEIMSDLDDLSVTNQNFAHLVDAHLWVDYMCVLQ